MRPVTEEQWKDAVEAANHLLKFEMGRIYGLLTNCHDINIEECVRIIEEGRARDNAKIESDRSESVAAA